MDYRLRPALLKHLHHPWFVADIAVVKLHGPGLSDGIQVGLLGGRRVEIVQVVQDGHGMALPEQTLAYVRADKPSTARDQNLHTSVRLALRLPLP